MKPRELWTAVVLLALPTCAAADPISIFYDSRSSVVSSSVRDLSGTMTQADKSSGDVAHAQALAATSLSEAYTEAVLTSSLADALHLYGNGTVTAGFNTAQAADVSAAAPYMVAFHLDQPYSFSFTSSFGGSDGTFDPTGAWAWGSWNAWLRPNTSTSAIFDVYGRDDRTVSYYGHLAAGDWSLYVDAAASGSAQRAGQRSATADYKFHFDLTPVNASPTPEPASMLLFGGGIAGLFAARRRA